MYFILFPAVGFHTCRINQPPAPRPIRLCGSPLHKADTKGGFNGLDVFYDAAASAPGAKHELLPLVKNQEDVSESQVPRAQGFFLSPCDPAVVCVTKVLSDLLVNVYSSAPPLINATTLAVPPPAALCFFI